MRHIPPTAEAAYQRSGGVMAVPFVLAHAGQLFQLPHDAGPSCEQFFQRDFMSAAAEFIPFQIARLKRADVATEMLDDVAVRYIRHLQKLGKSGHVPQASGAVQDHFHYLLLCHAFLPNKKATPWVAAICDLWRPFKHTSGA